MRSLLYEKKNIVQWNFTILHTAQMFITQHTARIQVTNVDHSIFKRVQESAADISVSQYQLRVGFQLHNRVHKQRNNLHLPLYDLA